MDFKFYQDVKISIWQRQTFTIEAENEEEAITKAKEYSNVDVSRMQDIDECNYLDETMELIDKNDNNGFPTIEVFSEKDLRTPICTNK